jgi:site-specific DNA-cytosine methylase
LGYQVREVTACEMRGAARQAHAHALAALAREFPRAISAKAGAQLHHRLPQDIRLVGGQQLRELGPIDIVVAGWPCQGSCAAGEGQGLDDGRSGLFTDLVRVLHTLRDLQKEWGRPLAYLIEHVAAGYDWRPKV